MIKLSGNGLGLCLILCIVFILDVCFTSINSSGKCIAIMDGGVCVVSYKFKMRASVIFQA